MSKWPEGNSPHRQNYLRKFAAPLSPNAMWSNTATATNQQKNTPMPKGFYGIPAHSSPNRFGAIGANFDRGTVTLKALEAAERVAAAGDKGISDRDVLRFDYETLRAAGVPIREENYRYFLDSVPAPKSYIVPNAPANTGAPVKWK